MVKPLELTIYPFVDRWVPYTIEFLGKPVTGESREYGYETPRGVFRGDEFPERRLTNAELAAETYKAEAEFRAAAGYGYATAIIRECDRKRSILERFATLPHYDQEQP